MRILQLRWKNLNSLTGTWCIDLDHPAFVTDGIFAITGPTGSGKTTILDALCLALYGSTPRLGKITKNSNEILSRQQGECFAEVAFATQTGRYRCHWSQRRARGRPDGELQAPRRELSELDSGRILATKISEVNEQIVALTGLDFPRFTRSMLLAQGAFDTFLQAAPDDRAPILERITGTALYSQISQAVHERTKLAREQYDQEGAQLAQLVLLTQEEERQLLRTRDEKERNAASLQRKIEEQQRALEWLGRLKQLQTEQEELTRAQADWAARNQAFQPDRQRLQAAQRALSLAGDYATWKKIRQDRDEYRCQLEEDREQLPRLADQVRRAEIALEKAANRQQNAESALEQAQPNLQKARQLDIQIAEKANVLRELHQTLEQDRADWEALRQKQVRKQGERDDVQAALSAHRKQGEAIARDAGLEEAVGLLQAQCESLENLQQDRQNARRRAADLAEQCAAASQHWEQQLIRLETELTDCENLWTQQQEQAAALRDCLGSREMQAWRNDFDELEARWKTLQNALEIQDQCARSRQNLADLESRIDRLQEKEQRLAKRLHQHHRQQEALKQQRAQLEPQFRLLDQMANLSAARQHLQAGQPCPLCGSRDHPFLRESPHQWEKLRGQQCELKAQEQDLSEQRLCYEKKLAESQGVRKALEEQQRQEQAQLHPLKEALKNACASLSLSPEALIHRMEETQHELARVQAVLEKAERLQENRNASQLSLDQHRKRIARIEQALFRAWHRWQAYKRQHEEAQAAEKRLAKQEQARRQALNEALQPFGCALRSGESPEALSKALENRRNRWRRHQERENELSQQLLTLDAALRQRAEKIADLETRLQQQEEKVRTLGDQRAELEKARRAVLEDRDPEAEKEALLEVLKEAQQHHRTAQQEEAQAQQAHKTLQTRLDMLETQIRKEEERLTAAWEKFSQRLQQQGFTLETYRAACLPEEERLALETKAHDLARKESSLKEQVLKNLQALEAIQAKPCTDRSWSEIQTRLQRLQEAQQRLREEIGALRHRLEENERRKARYQQGQSALATCRQEYERWQQLDQLIGSHDGKKFRNFVQGLTFDFLIQHANQKLAQMTDRYFLMRDVHQLELQVIDQYQAGTIRSTKNLSGGERFLVSLALALGLSQMASRTIRIDSLFLDEGFGTLDEDALEIALDMLASLRQEGKIIGLISHVPRLRERIATRLRVIPQAGGQSRIQGPGCRFLGR